MTLSELLIELRNIVLVHPEAAQETVESRTSSGRLCNHVVVRLKEKVVIIEGVSEQGRKPKRKGAGAAPAQEKDNE